MEPRAPAVFSRHMHLHLLLVALLFAAADGSSLAFVNADEGGRVHLSLGGWHSCAIFNDTNTKCWGFGGRGELGLSIDGSILEVGTALFDDLPAVDLGKGRFAISISGGEYYTCAVLDNSEIKCWGQNSDGQLGQGHRDNIGLKPGEMGDNLTAIRVGNESAVSSIVAGIEHSCALFDNGKLKCWGNNRYGQLGQGSRASIGVIPDDMGENLDFVDLGGEAIGVDVGSAHTCAHLKDLTVKCWGHNFAGQLGQLATVIGWRPNEMGSALQAVDLGDGRTVISLTTGRDHNCAILDNHKVKCWGRNTGGQLGLGHTGDVGNVAGQMGDNLPYVDLGSHRTAVSIVAAEVHTCALLDDSSVKCWGSNYEGQMGQGLSSREERWIGDEPNEMGDNLAAVDLGTDRTAVSLLAGSSSCCAVLDNGSVKCWGSMLHLGVSEQIGDEVGEMGDNLTAINGLRVVQRVQDAEGREVTGCMDEFGSSTCDFLAYCNAGACECMPGTYGSGTHCADTGFAIRYVLAQDISSVVDDFCPSNTAGVYMEEAGTDLTTGGSTFTVVYCIFATEDEATTGIASLGDVPSTVTPGIYRWAFSTTGNPIQVPPTGMELDHVTFSPSCAQSGCWVLRGVLTTGNNLKDNNAFNTFFLPHAEVDSQNISYDFDYSSLGNDGEAVEWTFDAAKHPCTTVSFDASAGNVQEVTTCCISNPAVGESGGTAGSKGGFLANYRTTSAFAAWAGRLTECHGPAGEIIARPGYDGAFDVGFPLELVSFLDVGKFTDLSSSPGVTNLTLLDPFFGQYSFEIQLDEVELRSKAGKLRGTVGIEHTIDTFLGVSNFRTTGLVALDTFSTQVAIHLEKTSFFSVSTHGTNDYTFLEYVNLRLVTVYKEDKDFSGTAESDDRTTRTSSMLAADYVQVTFTLGSPYGVNANDGLIPLDSVRAGQGDFLDSVALDHKCTEWDDNDGSFTMQGVFRSRLNQSCAPAAAMCSSPSSIPDSFVSFNIPLGIAFYPPPSDTLSANIFVDMVISATDSSGGPDPNGGDAPMQVKTTLTASIPVVEGGVNIFCDGYTAKTDLKDVANADIVVGTASSAEELTRLQIKEDIASTQLSGSAITPIDSDSMEAGLMTLVLKGEASYFESNTGRTQVTLELEDVVTLHLMESDGNGADADVASSVLALVTSSPADNSNAVGLDTDGYALNGAFLFTIDRSAQRAHLEPSTALLRICPFNPPRPANSVSLETCVTRRDVRYRGFPSRAGARSTAMEICAGDGTCTDQTDSNEARFMTTVLGDSAYARKLSVDYAGVIQTAYGLNGRYRRAYWINPGYEWTPTQTGGTPIFSVSQKLFLFALITLDEGLATGDDGAIGATLNLPTVSRRRVLLQSTPDQALQDGQASLNADAFQFKTTATSMMAKAFNVPEDRVATFKVSLQLTSAEACMTPTELQSSIRTTLDEYLTSAASALHTVQVMDMTVQQAGVSCGRRASRLLLSAYSKASAEVTMMVVFKAGTHAAVSLAKLQTMPAVTMVEPLSISPKVNTDAEETVLLPPGTDGDDASGSLLGLIAGTAGGCVALLLAGGMAVLWHRKNHDRPVASVVQINVEDLKHQLAADV